VTGERALVPGVRTAITLAVRPLPTPADRRRYYSEFVAELYGLPPADQARQVAGFVAQSLALRAALGGGGVVAEQIPFRRRFACHVLRWHDWHTFRTPDGERYSACSVCDKFPTDTFSRNSFGVG